jgi:hypothetical protein
MPSQNQLKAETKEYTQKGKNQRALLLGLQMANLLFHFVHLEYWGIY